MMLIGLKLHGPCGFRFTFHVVDVFVCGGLRGNLLRQLYDVTPAFVSGTSAVAATAAKAAGPAGSAVPSPEPLLALTYETNPVDSDIQANARLRLKLQPLCITFDRKLIETCGNFFAPPVNVDTRLLEDAAAEQFQEIKRTTQAQLVAAVQSRQIMELDIHLAAPLIVFPNASTKPTGLRMIINLGNFCFKSQRPLSVLSALSTSLRRHLPPKDEELWVGRYDAMTLDVRDMQIYLTTSDDAFLNRKYLLEPLKLNVHLMLASAESLSGDYPQVIIQAKLPRLSVCISPLTLHDLMSVLSTATTPLPSRFLPIPPPQRLAAPVIAETTQSISSSTSSESQAMQQPASIQTIVKRRVQMTRKDLVGDFIFPELSVMLIQDATSTDAKSDDAPTQIMAFRTVDISAKLEKRPYDMKLNLDLGAIALEDLVQPFGPAFQRFISTGEVDAESSSAFVAITYSACAAISPEWKGVAQLASIHIGHLNIHVNPWGINHIVTFLMRDLMPALSTQSDESNTRKAADVFSRPEHQKQALTRPTVARGIESHSDTPTMLARDHLTNIAVDLHFDGLYVNLNAGGQRLAEIKLQAVAIKFAQYIRTVQVEFSLRAISLHYFSMDAAKFTIVSSATESSPDNPPLIQMSFGTYHPLDRGFPGYSTMLMATLSGLQIQFMYRFVSELMLYSSTGPIGTLLHTLSASDPASRATETAYTTAVSPDIAPPPPPPIQCKEMFLTGVGFVRMDFKVADVELLIPRRSDSQDILKARVDTLHFSSELLGDSLDFRSTGIDPSGFDRTQQIAELNGSISSALAVTQLPREDHESKHETKSADVARDSDEEDAFFDAQSHYSLRSHRSSLLSRGPSFASLGRFSRSSSKGCVHETDSDDEDIFLDARSRINTVASRADTDNHDTDDVQFFEARSTLAASRTSSRANLLGDDVFLDSHSQFSHSKSSSRRESFSSDESAVFLDAEEVRMLLPLGYCCCCCCCYCSCCCCCCCCCFRLWWWWFVSVRICVRLFFPFQDNR
jgi:hypothetical protein